MRFLSTVIAGLVPGLVAGLVLGLLIIAFLTPLIVSAEKYESHPGKQIEGGTNQRNIATLLGTIIVGSAYGLILSSAYSLGEKEARANPILRGLKFGLIGFLIVYLVPSLAFLPNPPGLEAQATVAVRQSWWLSIIVLEVVGLFIYNRILQRFRSANRLKGHLLGFLSFLALVSVPFILGPPNKVGMTLIPAMLLIVFRMTSFAAMFVFWLTLGSLVGWVHHWLRQDQNWRQNHHFSKSTL